MPNSTVIPGLRYRNAPAAIEWFSKVFGFVRHAVYEGEGGTILHAELTLGGGMIMLGSAKDDEHSRGFKSPDELGGFEIAQHLHRCSRRRCRSCPRRRCRSRRRAPPPGHALRQSRVRRQRPRRPHLVRRHLRSLGQARIGCKERWQFDRERVHDNLHG